VHVDRQRRRRRVVTEAPLLLRDTCERQTATTELGRNRAREIARLAELVEVVREERVVAVVLRSAFGKALEHPVRQPFLYRR